MNRFENEFITWHHKTPVGIKVDEVFGMDSKKGKVWIEMAKQIFSEQGEPYYRVIEHYSNGAPFIEGLNARISISHTDHFFVAAFLPKTPEINLETYSPRAAMGIDAERSDREQVLKIRERFLSEDELELISKEDLTSNILAWTAKESLYKAALTPGLDFKNAIQIKSLPFLDPNPEKGAVIQLGSAIIEIPTEGTLSNQEFKLYSYESYGCCITIAFSPKCARFGSH